MAWNKTEDELILSINASKDLIGHIRRELKLSSLDTKAIISKKAHLENNVASLKKQIQFFDGFSFYFEKMASEINSISFKNFSPKGFDSTSQVTEICSVFEKSFFEVFSKFPEEMNIETQILFRNVSKSLETYCNLLKNVYKSLKNSKEMHIIVLYFSKLNQYEKLMKENYETCLSLLDDYDSLLINQRKRIPDRLLDIEKKIRNQFNSYQTIHLPNYRYQVESFNENNFTKISNLFRLISKESCILLSKHFNLSVKSLLENNSKLLNILVDSDSKVSHYESNKFHTVFENITSKHGLSIFKNTFRTHHSKTYSNHLINMCKEEATNIIESDLSYLKLTILCSDQYNKIFSFDSI